PGGRQAIIEGALKSQLYDLNTGLPAAQQPSVPNAPQWRCFSPDGRAFCIRSGEAYSVRVLQTGQQIVELEELKQPLGFTPDGRFLLGREPGYRIQCWDVTSGKPIWPAPALPALVDVSILAFRPDGESLIAGSAEQGIFRLWNTIIRHSRPILAFHDWDYLD